MWVTAKTLDNRRFLYIPLVAAGVVCLSLRLASPVWAQPAPGTEPSGCLPKFSLPAVPALPPRPPQGAGPGESWPVPRQGQDAAPVASLVAGMRGNDAVIKLVVGQGRLLTLKSDIASQNGSALIAAGDPTVADFTVLSNPRMIRLVGKRPGISDLSVVCADGQVFGFEVQVLFDLDLVAAHLRQAFPNDLFRLSQLRDVVLVEGEARSLVEIGDVLRMIEADLIAAQSTAWEMQRGGRGPSGPPTEGDNALRPAPVSGAAPGAVGETGNQIALNRDATSEKMTGRARAPRIINLIRVPGVHQVMLQVRVAELDRTALRQIGADLLGVNPATGNIYGTSLGNSTVTASGLLGLGGIASAASGAAAGNTTAFGIFPSANFEILIHALRENSLLSIMAEPNLMAMSGMQASFLAGGQFYIPVSQGGAGSASTAVSAQAQNFGVQLNFTPYVLADESIRLNVNPIVSNVDTGLNVSLVAGGSPVPGLDIRQASTTVEMRQGQTLAIAGLLSVTVNASTSRIPGLGDLPYIGPLFSNTSHQRVEKELLVLVTPYLVAPMEPGQVPCLPGADVKDPTDLEFFLKNRIEGRKEGYYRATANWDMPLQCRRAIQLDKNCVSGPVGFSQ